MQRPLFYFILLAWHEHLSRVGWMGLVGYYNFPPCDNSLAIQNHVYHTSAQTDLNLNHITHVLVSYNLPNFKLNLTSTKPLVYGFIFIFID